MHIQRLARKIATTVAFSRMPCPFDGALPYLYHGTVLRCLTTTTPCHTASPRRRPADLPGQEGAPVTCLSDRAPVTCLDKKESW